MNLWIFLFNNFFFNFDFFFKALQCNHPIVMYEVTLSIQRLVDKYGATLQEPAWSIILDIIEEVIAHTGWYLLFL